jgi:DnaJ-class molecular chaperone
MTGPRPAKIKERVCVPCEGTGRQIVKQHAQPGRKIYPPPCERCNGKGRVTVVPLSALWKVRDGTNVEPES